MRERERGRCAPTTPPNIRRLDDRNTALLPFGRINHYQAGRLNGYVGYASLLFCRDKSSLGVSHIDEAIPWDACTYT